MVATVDLSVIDEAFGPTSDLYTDVLGVKSNASSEQIQRAYFERRNDLFGLLADMDAEVEQDSITESHRFHAERQLDAVVMTLRILGDATARSAYDDLREDRTSNSNNKGGAGIHNSAASVAAMMKSSTVSRSYSMETEEVVTNNIHSKKDGGKRSRRLRSRRNRSTAAAAPPPPEHPYPGSGNSSLVHASSSVSSGLDFPAAHERPLEEEEDEEDEPESRNNSPVRLRVSRTGTTSSSSSSDDDEENQHENHAAASPKHGKSSSSSKRRSRKIVTPEQQDRQVRQRPPKQKSLPVAAPHAPPAASARTRKKQQQQQLVDDSDIEENESAFTLETQRTLDEAAENDTLATMDTAGSFTLMEKKRSTFQMCHDEIVGAIDDTSRSVEQVFSAFTLQDSDIKAVCSRIDRAVVQMNRSLKS